MSNRGTDQLVDHICDVVEKVWVLDQRDDLKNDCLTFVYANYEHYGKLSIEDLVIAFLSLKCADALSTADLDAMEREDRERKAAIYADKKGI